MDIINSLRDLFNKLLQRMVILTSSVRSLEDTTATAGENTVNAIDGLTTPVQTPITYMDSSGVVQQGSVVNFYDSTGNVTVTKYYDTNGNELDLATVTNIEQVPCCSGGGNNVPAPVPATARHILLDNQVRRFYDLKSLSFKVISGTVDVTMDGNTITYPVDDLVDGFSVSFDAGISNDILIDAFNGKVSVVYLGDSEEVEMEIPTELEFIRNPSITN